MKCLNCNSNEGVFQPPYGWMNCSDCQKRHSSMKIKETVEITTDGIKEERKVYADDIEQPFREGVFNKRYFEKYGTEGVNVTQDDIKNSKDVWVENHYYND